MKPGTIVFKNNSLRIINFSGLQQDIKDFVLEVIKKYQHEIIKENQFDTLVIDNISIETFKEITGKISSKIKENFNSTNHSSNYDEKINFEEVFNRAKNLSKHLKKSTKEIAKALENFETYNVILDEIERSIDHLENLDKNKEYFDKNVNKVVTFLPLNQPLYALVCFGIVPSFMSKKVFVRPPEIVQPHFQKLIEVISLSKFVPNLHVHFGDRPSYFELTKNDIDVIIFTGKPENGKKVYKKYKPKLFILNGAGHNPLVITETADLELAMESALRVVLQNQGQDCAGPNSILVHESVLESFKNLVINKVKNIISLVGDYKNRKNIVGPNSNPDALLETLQILDKNKQYYIYGGNINIRTNMICPAVFEKPLKEGGSFDEFFAPIFMIQPYTKDSDLSKYFEDPQYLPNAMYISVFGNSRYIESLIDKKLHTTENILHNKDLHLVERGFMPYGGLGPNASCIYFNDESIPGSTLPQRDIYNYLVKSK